MILTDDFTTAERTLMSKATASCRPINGSLELLPLCNMNCDMCYVRLSYEDMSRLGRLRTVEEWLDIGRQMQKSGVLFLLLTGGEPLLYPGFKEVFIGLKRMGMILTINTNGTLIDEEWADFFAANQPRRINITLYGANNTAYDKLCHYPDGFEKVIGGIRLLKQRGIDVKIGGSLTKANQHDISEITAIGQELEAPVRIDTYMMPATRERTQPYHLQSRLGPEVAAVGYIEALRHEMTPEIFKAFIHKYVWEVEHILPDESSIRHTTCHAGCCSFSVNWQGELHPCVIMTSPSANVFETGFEKAWQHVSQAMTEILLCPECNRCSLRPLCRNCAACALLEGGHYDAKPDYMCRYTREIYRLMKNETEKWHDK